MAVSLLGMVALIVLAKPFFSGMHEVFSLNFSLAREEIFDPAAALRHLGHALRATVVMLLPFFGVTVVVAILASIALGGFNVSAEAMAPKLSTLDPIKGMKKVFSMRGLMELLKSMAKFFLIAGATALLLWWWTPDLLRLGAMDVGVAIVESAHLIGWGGILVASTLILIAAVDVPFQLWDHKRQLKMTQQEVREEFKETEGRPEVRGRIRQLQREMAQRRMMEEVPKADVIVTNPTHYAVALRYDQDKMNAPIVVAKGTELIAANIRRVGTAHDVPIVEAPLLARAIYFNTELNEAIPATLYLAVAQLLAYVFQLHAFEEVGGDIPQAPTEFPIPEGVRTEERSKQP
jgi:flagellar biosynthetic protein FlhB